MRKDIVFENITQCTVIDTSDWWGACTRTTAVFNYIIKVSRKINSESIVKMSRALERDMEKGVFFFHFNLWPVSPWIYTSTFVVLQ